MSGLRKNTCATCGETKNYSSFTKSDLNNFCYAKQNVRCTECKAQGHTAHRGPYVSQSHTEHQCGRCDDAKTKFHFRFTNNVRHTVCRDCETVTCPLCDTEVSCGAYQKKQLDNHFTCGVGLLCKVCAEKGFTIQDSNTYKCNTCLIHLGCRMFNTKEIYNFNQRGGKLICRMCYDSIAKQKRYDTDREKQLKRISRTSKRKGCTCGSRAEHAPRCPMHITRAGERTYPWCDVMSVTDSKWLQKRKQRKTQ